jgi:hypothetical protein
MRLVSSAFLREKSTRILRRLKLVPTRPGFKSFLGSNSVKSSMRRSTPLQCENLVVCGTVVSLPTSSHYHVDTMPARRRCSRGTR